MKLLNQYRQRTVPGYHEVSGGVLGNNTITANRSAPWRKGEFFGKELTAANSSVPVWRSIQARGVVNQNLVRQPSKAFAGS